MMNKNTPLLEPKSGVFSFYGTVQRMIKLKRERIRMVFSAKLPDRFKTNQMLLLAILAGAVLSVSGCAGHKPYDMILLASQPLKHSWASIYPSIETVYESDREVTAVPYWDEIHESKNKTIRLVIYDDKGKAVIESVEKNVTLQSNIYLMLPIELKRDDKPRLMPGAYKASLYIDDQLSADRRFQYVSTSILNKNIKQAVILPFRERAAESNLVPDSMQSALNTASHAIYNEVKRIIPEAIPHYIVEEKIGKLIVPGCLENRECVAFLKNTFDSQIFISGYIELVRFKEQLATIKVEVYNAETGNIKGFHHGVHAVTTYGELIHDLLKGVMQQEGLLDYLKTVR